MAQVGQGFEQHDGIYAGRVAAKSPGRHPGPAQARAGFQPAPARLRPNYFQEDNNNAFNKNNNNVIILIIERQYNSPGVTFMSISSDIKDRIFAAADRLYQASDRESFPTVDAVRREAKTDMNAASAAMKEWRKVQTATPVAVAVAVPEAIGKAAGELIVSVWTEAQALANASLHSAEAAWAIERAEADELRAELSESFDAQGLEVEGLTQRLATAEHDAQQAAAQHLEQVNGLQQQIQAGETSLHETREKLAETKGLLVGTTAQLENAQGALAKTETALGVSEQHCAQLEQQLQALRDKNAELATQLDHATSRATQAETLVEMQRQALTKAEQATQEATAKVVEIDGDFRKLQMQSERTAGKTEALEKQLEALHKTLEKQTWAETKPEA